jgi:hypothetical protein
MLIKEFNKFSLNIIRIKKIENIRLYKKDNKMATLAEIRQKLQSQQNNKGNTGGGSDRSMYPFWDTPMDQTSTLRFLPDADPANTFFWVERLVIKLPFQGIKGGDDKPITVQVPCMEMYGETDYIISETRPWWKDPELQPMARIYYKKRSFIFQGFVVNSAFEEKEVPENPIRRFAINSSIYDIIKASLMNPEIEDMPVDFINGRDFKLAKTNKGGFPNYSTSSWSFKTRALSEKENAAIEEYGLFNLRDYLPKKPTEAEQSAIKEMFHASVNNEAYDASRWGNYYRPYGLTNTPTDSDSEGSSRLTTVKESVKPTITTKPTIAASPEPEDDEPVVTASTSTSDTKATSAQEILARLRSRKQGS